MAARINVNNPSRAEIQQAIDNGGGASTASYEFLSVDGPIDQQFILNTIKNMFVVDPNTVEPGQYLMWNGCLGTDSCLAVLKTLLFAWTRRILEVRPIIHIHWDPLNNQIQIVTRSSLSVREIYKKMKCERVREHLCRNKLCSAI